MTDTEIISLAFIQAQAVDAAERFIRTKEKPENQYPAGSEAAKEWKRRFEIALLRLTAPADAQGGA